MPGFAKLDVDAANMVAFLNGKSKNEVQFLEYSDENKTIENCKLFYEKIYPGKAGQQVNNCDGVKFIYKAADSAEDCIGKGS